MAKIHFLCTALINGVARNAYDLIEGERVELLLLGGDSDPLLTSLYFKNGVPFSRGCVVMKGEHDYYLKREKRVDRIWQESFTKEGEEVLATLYSDRHAVLCVDYKSNFVNYPLECNIKEARLACDIFCNNILLFAKNDDRTRIVVMNVMSLKVILDTLCDDYSFDENLTYTIKYNDIVNRRKRVIIGFNDEGIIPFEKVFECEDVHVSTPAQMKLSFLQGMNAEDYDYAKKLLSEDMKENFSDIIDFLGTGDDVIPLNDKEFLYGDRIVTFECDNDKITDISVSE